MTPQYPESPHLFPTYRRQPVTFVKGRGAALWDKHGRRYLDFFAGLAVCNLGHAHPAVAKAAADQLRTLLHTSNIYFTGPQLELARELTGRTFGKAFFSNSGAEANECAIKLARRFGERTPARGKARYEIIVFRNSFHGRTLATLAATGQEKFHKGFGPLPGRFPIAEFGDAASAARLVTPLTCSVLVEPIQGEGGVNVAEPSFFRALRDLCRRRNLLLIFDEIQTGIGRTGTLFAYQNPRVVAAGVRPDVLTSAKALANGLPMAATLARKDIADMLAPGDHGTTFGGGAVPCRAALAVLETLTPAYLARVRALGELFRRELGSWIGRVPAVKSVRGAGLMWGIELDRPGAEAVKACREAGLLVNCTAEKVIRLLPPLCLTSAEARRGLQILRENMARSLKND